MNLCYSVVSQLLFLSFVTVEFCHNLNVCVVSQFAFWSFVTICVFLVVDFS